MREVTCVRNLMNRYVAGEKYKYTPLRTKKAVLKVFILLGPDTNRLNIFLLEAARKVKVKNARSK